MEAKLHRRSTLLVEDARGALSMIIVSNRLILEFKDALTNLSLYSGLLDIIGF